jgi:hypothetical protein
MEVIVAIIVVLVLLLVPLKLAAGWCNASNNSWTTCVIAVIGSVVANKVGQSQLADPLLALVAVMGLTMVFYSLIFGVTLLRGGLIALLAIGIQYVAGLVLVGIGLSLSA